MNFKDYLSNGQFETFIPGNASSFELGKKSKSIDTFLNSKGAKSFAFLSFNDFSTFGPINSPEEERVFLDSQEDADMNLMMKAGELEWIYYMAGFRPNNNWGALGGILVLDPNIEALKKEANLAGINWLVTGAIGEAVEFSEW